MTHFLLFFILTQLTFFAADAAEKSLPADALSQHTRRFEERIGFREATRNHVVSEKIVFDWSTIENPPHLPGWTVIGKGRESLAGPRARERWQWGYLRKTEAIAIEVTAYHVGENTALLAIRDFAYKSNMIESPYTKGPSDLGTLSLISASRYGYEAHWAYRDLEFSVDASDKALALKTAYWLDSIAQAHCKPR